MPGDNEQASDPSLFSKLAGLQSIIPQFDNCSAITPKYFIDSVESITKIAKCSDADKLMILKSRLRGEALSHVINSPDLTQEIDYKTFCKNFLKYFDSPASLATRQQLFSNCKMIPKEQIKVYAARVCNSTHRFFGTIDITNEQVNQLVEQTKLSKFLDGLTPEYKKFVLLKDPTTFQDAVNYAQLLQSNEQHLQETPVNATINTDTERSDFLLLKDLIQSQAELNHQSIAALSQEIQNLKVSSHNYNRPSSHTPVRAQRQNFHTENSRIPMRRYDNSNRSFRQNRPRFQVTQPPCGICSRTNHVTQDCYFRQSTSRDNPTNFPSRGSSRPLTNSFATQRSAPRVRFDNDSRGNNSRLN